MVNPKKDYELLMRYLQGDAQKREPAAAPEQAYKEARQLPVQPLTGTTPLAPEPVAPAPRVTAKPFHFYWPKWRPVALGKKVRIAVATSAVLLLAVLLWNMYIFYQLSPELIYDKVYVPFRAVATNPQAPVEKNSIAQYYTAGNYVAATLQAKKNNALSEKEKLLTGLSYLQRANYTKAIKWLEPLSNNFKSPYRQAAEFYLTLAYLKNGDFDHCIERMEHIAYTPSHLYHDRISKGIINDVKMLKWK